MSRTLLHDWECSIEKNKNNTEELLKIAEDIYNTAYARGKASEERPQGKWVYHKADDIFLPYIECSVCHTEDILDGISPQKYKLINKFCPNCGADMRGKDNGLL